MFSQSQNSYSGFLFNDSKIRKSFDKTALENCIFIRKYIKRLLTSVFNSRFKFLPKYHSYDARWADLRYFKMPVYRTKTYGKYSINANAIYVSNHSLTHSLTHSFLPFFKLISLENRSRRVPF